MKRLAPGVYDDGNGGMHVDLTELLAAHGFPDTPAHREALIKAVNETYNGPITETDAPVPRPRYHVVVEHNEHGGTGWAIFDRERQRVEGGWFIDRIAAETHRRRVESIGEEMILIWSFEHDAWWKPGRRGYTTNVAEAGHYAEIEAKEIVDSANRYSKQINETLAYQCPRCHRVSYNPNDLEHRYCGNCHQFENL